ncbi:MAG: SBBP repeat-containing protein [Candidatus Sulfotelmatobacter sp.]
MNVDRRWWETSVVRGRVLAAGLVLLVAGCAVLGLSTHLRLTPATAANTPTAGGIETAPGLLPASTTSPLIGQAQLQARSLFAGLPLTFEPNQGQGNLDPADPRAKFVAHGSGYSLFLGTQGAILSLVSRERPKSSAKDKTAPKLTRIESVEMKLAGANANLSPTAAEPLPGKSNYLIGNDPSKWRRGVPQFARVQYQDVYPGINLVFYGNQGRLEYDFQVAPGADPAQAEIEFNGAKKLEVEDGALIIRSDADSVRLEAPRVYQEVAGKKQTVEGSFVLRGKNHVGFAVGAYDRSRELIIDPILNFSTYFGGSGDELSTSIAVDGSLNIYITGSTTSPNLPFTSGVIQTSLNGAQNIYVAKITPPLGSIVAVLDYVTYLGGNGTDSPVGIAVDGGGDAFVAGTTSSTNFPTTATTAYQTGPETGSTGTSHVFVSELNSGPTPTAASELLYSTYLSGNGTDVASGMAIDALGNVFVTGTTTSTDVANASSGVQFPASTLPDGQAFQIISNSSIQFFVTKVNTTASRASSISYSTYFGGSNFQTATPIAVGGGIAVDTSGNVYFSGTTNFTYTGCSGCGSTDFPILNAYQPCLDTAPPTVIVNPPSCTVSTTATASDAFVAKLNPNAAQGQQLQWSTYLGGSQDDSSTGVALDTGAANVYVVGTTDSSDFVAATTLPTFAPYQACLNNNPVTTTGVSCPVSTAAAPTDAFVARVSNPAKTTGTPTNVTLGYFSYLGGSNNEEGLAIVVDSAAGALITGWTQSPFTTAGAAGNFPVSPYPNSIQSSLNGPQNAFVARLNTAAVIGQTTIASWANYYGGSGTDAGTGIALDVNQDTYVAGQSNSTNLFLSKPIPVTGTQNNGGYDAFVTQLGTAVSVSISGVLTLGTNQTFIPAGTQATFTYTITNNGPDLASNLSISDNFSPTITGVPLTFVSASISSGTCGGVSTNSSVTCTLPSLQSGSTATVTIVLTPTPNSSGSQAEFNGGTVQVSGQGNIVFAQTSVPATMSDFLMSVSPNNFSVAAAGDTATYQVNLTPHPLYQSSIALSCSGQPTGATCNFTPATSIILQSVSGATATLSIPTTARPIVTPAAFVFPRWFLGIWLAVPGLVMCVGGRKRRRIAGVLMLCTIFGLLVFLPACSHSSTQAPVSGTPAGTYTITVTAAAGTDSKSQSITLTVP